MIKKTKIQIHAGFFWKNCKNSNFFFLFSCFSARKLSQKNLNLERIKIKITTKMHKCYTEKGKKKKKEEKKEISWRSFRLLEYFMESKRKRKKIFEMTYALQNFKKIRRGLRVLRLKFKNLTYSRQTSIFEITILIKDKRKRFLRCPGALIFIFFSSFFLFYFFLLKRLKILAAIITWNRNPNLWRHFLQNFKSYQDTKYIF